MKYIKALAGLLLLAVLVMIVPARVYAEEDMTKYSFGHFYYHAHEGYVSICGYLGTETEVEIPSSIGGRPVSEVESGSFQGCNNIETIIVPDTVVLAYEDSFTGAGSLGKIISYTVGVNIQAGGNTVIEYVNDENPSSITTPDTDSKAPDNNETNTGDINILDNASQIETPNSSEIGDYVYEEVDNDNTVSLDEEINGVEAELKEENQDSSNDYQFESITDESEDHKTILVNKNDTADNSKEKSYLPVWVCGALGVVIVILAGVAMLKKRK